MGVCSLFTKNLKQHFFSSFVIFLLVFEFPSDFIFFFHKQVGSHFGWRYAFWVEAILMLPFAILGFVMKPLQLKGAHFYLTLIYCGSLVLFLISKPLVGIQVLSPLIQRKCRHWRQLLWEFKVLLYSLNNFGRT